MDRNEIRRQRVMAHHVHRSGFVLQRPDGKKISPLLQRLQHHLHPGIDQRLVLAIGNIPLLVDGQRVIQILVGKIIDHLEALGDGRPDELAHLFLGNIRGKPQTTHRVLRRGEDPRGSVQQRPVQIENYQAGLHCAVSQSHSWIFPLDATRSHRNASRSPRNWSTPPASRRIAQPAARS